jgi:dUTP pyrophosphatase
MKLKLKKLHEAAKTPTYGTKFAAGFDIASIEQVTINAGETRAVRTGLSFEIPEGYELEIRPRSGLSLKTKIRIANAPATIDSDFRGEVLLIVDNIMNKFPEPYIIVAGQKLAQGFLRKVDRVEFEEVEELTETERGENGFGSSGR